MVSWNCRMLFLRGCRSCASRKCMRWGRRGAFLCFFAMSLCSSSSPYLITTKTRQVSPVQSLPLLHCRRGCIKAKILLSSHRSRRGLMEFIPPRLQTGLNKALHRYYPSQSAAPLYMLKWFSIHIILKSEMLTSLWLA